MNKIIFLATTIAAYGSASLITGQEKAAQEATKERLKEEYQLSSRIKPTIRFLSASSAYLSSCSNIPGEILMYQFDTPLPPISDSKNRTREELEKIKQ